MEELWEYSVTREGHVDLSVIIPVLDEEGSLRELYERLVSTLESLPGSYEIVFSDDGSRDRTPQVLKDISHANSRVKVVTLPENLGQHRAILAGFEQSRGQIIVTLDGDLQNHPEDIPRLIQKMGQGYDVVAGWRRGRKDRFYRKVISWVLSWLASGLTGLRLRDYGCMLRAYGRWVFERLSLCGEKSIFIPTFVNRFDVKVAEIEVGHSPRKKGRSKYTLPRLLNLYSDLISDSSLFPPWFVRLLGAFLAMFGLSSRTYGLPKRSPADPADEEKGPEDRSKPIRICVFAYGEIGYVCLEELLREGERVVVVVTHRDEPGERIWFRSVRDLASENLIPVYQPSDANAPQFVGMLRELRPELILSFTYRQVLSREVLEIPAKGAINLHPSLLPKYRGRCPANWVLINGEEETGVTLHYMEERVDSGDMAGQREVKISPDDTIRSLYDKLAQASVELLRDTLPKIRTGELERIPQREEEATYFGGRRPEDGRIDWGKPAQEIYNLIRAVTHPYPGAFFYYRGAKVWCWEAELAEGRGEPGQVLGVNRGDGVLVSCSEGALLLSLLQAEGGEEGPGAHVAEGLGIKEGDILT